MNDAWPGGAGPTGQYLGALSALLGAQSGAGEVGDGEVG